MDIDFSRILILDDNPTDPSTEEFRGQMESRGRFTILANPVSMAPNDLRQLCSHADLIVLDWILGDDELYAVRLVKEVLLDTGLPLVIFTTEDASDVEGKLTEEQIWCPDTMKHVNKCDVANADETICQHISGSDHMGLVFSYTLWRPAVDQAIRKAMKRVSTWRRRTLEILLGCMEQDGQQPQDVLLSVLEAVLQQEFSAEAESDALVAVKEMARAAQESAAARTGAIDETELQAVYRETVSIRQALVYDKAPKQTIGTGDIVCLSDEGTRTYGLVVSPRCTLARSCGTMAKVLVGYGLREACRIDLCLDEVPDDTRLKKWIEDTSSRSYRVCFLHDAPELADQHIGFLFNHVQTYGRDALLQRRKVRVRSPFIDDIMQAYVRFQSRRGVPTLPLDIAGKYEEKKYRLAKIVSES